ncbi:uncharacterized protein LOC106153277 [Lingula anatina]|uniref:Uncharacterized protein LOC106153277 n=1 Tax=Lingula anatina TaxID=7574 RepID=A0A1S3HAW6_LINAN|nr:uncharacterized protein LOC106153277 [Lingula anatina]|eukprot:XP_013382606.1 uncharacterized protein LOC106153277 [Lingula anatina]
MDLRNVVVSALLVFAVVLRQHGAEASQMCYVCSYTMSGDPSRDYECVNDPANVKTGSVKIMCDKWCTVHKVTQRDTGKIWSFSRGCEEYKQTQCIDSAYTECSESCNGDLCNSLDYGTPPIGGTDNEDPAQAQDYVSTTTETTTRTTLNWIKVTNANIIHGSHNDNRRRITNSGSKFSLSCFIFIISLLAGLSKTYV